MKRFHMGLCIILSLSLLLAPLSTAAQGYVSKDESVYVLLDEEGAVLKQTVSSWLHADEGLDTVIDFSCAADIVNLKGHLLPRSQGDGLLWDTKETDVYYQGSAQGQLPVGVEIGYKLDGQIISPQDLAGRCGRVEISLKLTNAYARQERIAGRERQIAPLFLTGILVDLPVDQFANVQAENGTILSESANQLVAFASVPGLKDAFDGIREEDLKEVTDKLHDEFTVCADVTDFELPSIVIAVTSQSGLLDEGGNLDEDLEDMLGDLDELNEATGDLTDGTGKLEEAGRQFNQSMKTFERKYKDFDQGVKSAQEGSAQLSAGARALSAGMTQLSQNISAMSGALDPQTLSQISRLLSTLPSLSISSEDRAAIQALPSLAAAIPQQMAQGILSTLNGMVTTQTLETVETEVVSETGKPVVSQVGQVVEIEDEPKLAPIQSVREISAQDQAAPKKASKKSKTSKKSKGTKITTTKTVETQVIEANLDGFTPQQLKTLNQVINAAAEQTSNQVMAQFESVNQKLTDFLQTYDQAMAALSAIDDPQKLLSTAAQMSTALEQLTQGVNQLTQGAKAVQQGGDQLCSGLGSLSEASDKIKKAIAQFKRGTGELRDKTGELNDGAQEYKTDGIDELTDRLTGLADDAREALAVKEAVRRVSQDFNTYTGAPEGASTTVKYIMKTPEIRIPAPQAEDEQVPQEQDLSVWDRLRALFQR